MVRVNYVDGSDARGSNQGEWTRMSSPFESTILWTCLPHN